MASSFINWATSTKVFVFIKEIPLCCLLTKGAGVSPDLGLGDVGDFGVVLPLGDGGEKGGEHGRGHFNLLVTIV
jgi:hypothetical protein